MAANKAQNEMQNRKLDHIDGALVSIVVPTYNYGLFLNESLQKVRQQTYQNWECIIVDDGSTDNSKEVVSEFVNIDTRFKYIYQENEGVSCARNAGIREAKGDYIQFLDADDYMDEFKLEENVRLLEGNSEYDLVYSDEVEFHVDENNQMLPQNKKVRSINLPESNDELLERVLGGTILGMDNPLMRRRVVEEVGGFHAGIDTGQDWLFWFEVIYKGFAFFKTPGQLIYIRVHSFNKKQRNFLRSQLLLRESIHSHFLSKYHLHVSNKFKHWYVVAYARERGLYHMVFFYTCQYFLKAFPRSNREFKIFVGDFLMPGLVSRMKFLFGTNKLAR